jgi:hypothetical protein
LAFITLVYGEFAFVKLLAKLVFIKLLGELVFVKLDSAKFADGKVADGGVLDGGVVDAGGARILLADAIAAGMSAGCTEGSMNTVPGGP